MPGGLSRQPRRFPADGGRAGIRGDSSRLISTGDADPICRAGRRIVSPARDPRPGMGDPGRRICESGPCPRRGGGRPRPGAGPAPRRCPGAAADTLWRLGSLSRAPSPLVSERRVRRLLAAQPAPTPVRRRPAKSLLTCGCRLREVCSCYSAGAGTSGRRNWMRAPPAHSRLAINSAATTTSTSRGRPASMIMP